MSNITAGRRQATAPTKSRMLGAGRSRILRQFVWLAVLWTALFLLPRAAADAPYAAALTVTQNDTEIMRAGTNAALILPIDSTTVIGEGDVIITDRRGRAYIQFEDVEILLLPESRLEIRAFRRNDDGQIVLDWFVQGRSIYHVPTPDIFAAFRLETPHSVLTEPAGFFGIESQNAVDFAVADAGSVMVTNGGGSLQIADEEGVRIADEFSEPVRIGDVPINFARVEGELDGCAGTIQTEGGVLLRVRAGPSPDFFFMGSIADDTPVQIMGRAPGPGGVWYRIQFLSDFGWVLGEAIESDCDPDGLREYPRDGIENAPGIVLVKDFEIALLAPFFGDPANDVWFYRRLNLEGGGAPQQSG